MHIGTTQTRPTASTGRSSARPWSTRYGFFGFLVFLVFLFILFVLVGEPFCCYYLSSQFQCFIDKIYQFIKNMIKGNSTHPVLTLTRKRGQALRQPDFDRSIQTGHQVYSHTRPWQNNLIYLFYYLFKYYFVSFLSNYLIFNNQPTASNFMAITAERSTERSLVFRRLWWRGRAPTSLTCSG